MSNFKKNIWKYGIIGACIAFASLMISFGIMAGHHHIDLVVSDYYKEEIAFQKQINKENNYKALAVKPVITVDSANKKMHISFPHERNNNAVTGRLMFYRPDNQKYDDTVALHVDDAGLTSLSLNKYQAGKWKMRMEWMHNDTACRVEKIFNL